MGDYERRYEIPDDTAIVVRLWRGRENRWTAARGDRDMRHARLLLALVLALSGCGLVAAPCRVGSAALKIVPVVGHVAAAPTDACAGAIDP